VVEECEADGAVGGGGGFLAVFGGGFGVWTAWYVDIPVKRVGRDADVHRVVTVCGEFERLAVILRGWHRGWFLGLLA